MTKWLSHIDINGDSILEICAKHEKEGETLIKLLGSGGEFFPKEEMAMWLSHVNNDGWSVLHSCARYQEEGETLIKLLEYG